MSKEKEIKVRVLTEHYMLEGTLPVMEGHSLEMAVDRVKEFFVLRDVRYYNLNTGAYVFSAKITSVNRERVLSLTAVNEIDETSAQAMTEMHTLPPEFATTKVSDLMSTRVLTIRTDDDVNEAYRLMSANRIRHLPVIEKNQLVGLVSDRDLRTFLLSGNAMPIEEMMVQVVRLKTIKPTQTIHKACEVMAENKISCLPVVAGGELQGILTETDLLRYLHDILGKLT